MELMMEKEFTQTQYRSVADVSPVISVKHFNLWYTDFQALKDISLDIPEHRATAFIGPSGCGKSTLLRTFNRMCDFVEGVRTEGVVEFKGQDIFKTDANALRVHVGMVFQHPNPFPMSIRENILYGPARMKRLSRDEGDQIVERCLTRAALWGEVTSSTRAALASRAASSSACASRAPWQRARTSCSWTSPQAPSTPSQMVEELMVELSRDHTVVVVTHNMQQATRVADKTAFFYLGQLIEEAPTAELFSNPRETRTQEYLSGRFS